MLCLYRSLKKILRKRQHHGNKYYKKNKQIITLNEPFTVIFHLRNRKTKKINEISIPNREMKARDEAPKRRRLANESIVFRDALGVSKGSSIC